MTTCPHHNVIFIGWQLRRDGSKYPLYNCLACHSTVDLHILFLDRKGIPHPQPTQARRDQ